MENKVHQRTWMGIKEQKIEKSRTMTVLLATINIVWWAPWWLAKGSLSAIEMPFFQRFSFFIFFLVRLYFSADYHSDTVRITHKAGSPKSIQNCRFDSTIQVYRQETISRRLEVRLARLTQAIDLEAIRDFDSKIKKKKNYDVDTHTSNIRMKFK